MEVQLRLAEPSNALPAHSDFIDGCFARLEWIMLRDLFFGRHREAMSTLKHGTVEISYSRRLNTASEIDFVHESGFIKIGAPLDEIMGSRHTIFRVQAMQYSSSAGFDHGALWFERNGVRNELNIENEFGSVGLAFGWTPTELICAYALNISPHFADEGWFPTQRKKVATPHTLIPASVFQAALTAGTYEDGRYRSSEDLLRTLVRVLECLERDIHRHASQRLLWQGNSPLSEPEVTRFVGTLLTNYGNLLSFQVLTEARAGAGDTDFHISAYTRRGTMVQIALEGKFAHSRDVLNGLYKQLPSYIRSLSADFGIYLIYWMRCEKFQDPSDTKGDFNNRVTTAIDIPSNIRVVLLDFSYPIMPSKL
jgi:hypothetical protein